MADISKIKPLGSNTTYDIKDASAIKQIQKGSANGTIKYSLRGTPSTYTSDISIVDLTSYALLDSPEFTGTPTAPTADDGTNNTQIANTAFVMNTLKYSDAMIFKGTVAGSSSTPGGFTVAANCGDTYKVSTAGYVNGVKVEVGDTFICTTDNTAAATSSNYSTIQANWVVLQTNADGIVTGPASATDSAIALYNGTSGKIIKNSSKTLTETTVSSNATNSTIPTSKAVWDAIAGLDGNLNNTTPGAGKTLTAFSQTDGTISATFGNISITKSQISDFPTSMTPTSHSHGNIANGGTITSSTVALGNGDMLLFSDSSNNGKIERSSITIGTATTTYLRNDGTWGTPDGTYTLPIATYNTLGGLKPAYTSTGAATGYTAATNTSTPALQSRTTTTGRYYAIEADKNGIPFVNVPWSDTNKYHKTGSWSGLTYTASAVNSADELKFTIPTGTSATTVAVGNHTHSASLAADTGTATVTLEHNTTYKLTTGGNSIIFKTPVDNNTDTKVTSAANHYTPSADTNSALSVDASSTTAASWNSTSLVTGVNIERDAKGHVTGLTVDSIKMPANPNSNTTYTLSGAYGTNNATWVNTLKPSSGNATTSTVPAMVGASASAAGKAGLVPVPAAGKQASFLRGDGTWVVPTDTDTKVTQSTASGEAWRKVLLNGGSSTNYEAWNTAVGNDVTDIAYRTLGVSVQPSTNTLKANNLYAANAFNNLITGTGTAAKDNGEGSTNRYMPAKWTFNTGSNAVDGNIYTIKVPVAGHDYGVFLSVDNGTNYYPVVANGTGRVTTHYPVDTYLQVIFESTGSAASIFPVAGGTARVTVSNGAFRVINYYDSNSNDTGYYHRKIYTNIKAGANKIFPYALIMQNKDGRWESIVTSSSNGTSKAKNTHGFLLEQVWCMCANKTYNENVNVDTYNIWTAHSGLIDMRYSINVTTSSGMTGYKPVYLVGTIGTDGLFYLADTWWSQTLPTTDDGKIYIYIGDAYDAYRLTLSEVNTAYFFRDSRLQMYGAGRGIKGISRSGTTFTVTRDDGSTFTFNQQDNNTTSFTITANATDGIWYLTGTNGTNAVTYAVAPYSSQQSKASFDTSSTNPTRNDRLNYNGYLYATKLYSGGKEVLTDHQSLDGYIPKSTLSGAYDIMYSSAANTPTRLGANTTTTKKFLRMTGTGSAGAAPAWDTVTKSDVGLSNVENTKLSTWTGTSNITTIGTLSSGTVPWARLSNVPSASTSAAGIIQIGTGASNAAAGNHTHTTSIATDNGTNQITLALGTKYKLTAGGTSYIFTMPSNPNTDTKVTQTDTTSDASEYRVLLSGSANDTTETTTARKNTNLRFNPSTNILSIGGSISTTGDLDITGNATINGETYADSITAGSLMVTGAASFTNIPTAPTPVADSNDTSIATTAFVMNAFTANDAMVFKGVINANSALPADHKQGWTYRIGTAGTYANKVCEVGDIIICVTDGTAANNDHWAVIQNNIDGAVYKGTNAFTDAHVIIADSTAGKVKDSGKTITATAPASGAADTTIPTSKAVWSAISGASGYGKTGTVTQVTAGTGLSIGTTAGGNFTTSGTINHTNSVTAQTTQALYPIKIDAQGHISAYGTAVTSLPASDVSAWAKAANKPSYNFSEIGSKPTTLSGYGITDAKIANGVITLGSNSITPLTSHQSLDGYLPLTGGTMTGQIKTSFKSSIAMGSYASDTTTIPDLIGEVRYSSGCAGSFQLQTAYTKNSITIPTAWYNFLYIPHRSGGVNGAASDDNCSYGVLYLHNMTAPTNGDYSISWKNGSIDIVRMNALFTAAPADAKVLIADGTKGGIKSSGYTIAANVPSNAVFTDTDTKQNITLATTSKAFITGVTTTPTSSAQALTGVADTGVYLTTTAGELSAVRHSFNISGTEKAYIAFNSTTNAIDFIFA